MSASPAGQTSSGRTPNGAPLPPKARRRPKPADPLIRTKKRPAPNSQPPQPTVARTSDGVAQHNGMRTDPLQTVPVARAASPLPLMLVDKSSKSGFSSDLQPGQYTDYPVVISKKSLLEKIRHHVIRFQGQDVDPRNQKEFTRPLKLHRRDARAPLPGTKEYLEEQERRKDASFKAEIDPERAAAMAEIAPSASKPRKPMKQNKKKIMGFVKRDETEGKTTESMIRYEEAMPWQLEDFDNKQIWGGVYEAALSETWAQLEFQGDKFVVTPVEKWYKFQPRTRIDPEKLKQIQEQNRARTKREESDEPNWIKKLGDKNARDAEEEKMDRKARGLYSAKGVDEGDTAGFAGGGEDGDEIDFEEDFADDEAPPAIEGEEEDIKHVEQRVKRDMLKANVFAIKEETDYDKEELQERLLREQEKRFGKTLRKALVKREKNLKYESNSDNPYSSSSESIDTEAEEERKRQEEAEKAEADKSSPEKGKKDPPSATNTKGTNTPSHRAEKRNPSNSLKRPGSPNLSDVSGNESARKKQKMKPTIGTSKLGTGVNTPNGPPSRPRSPAVPINGNAAPPRLAGAGSGSDTDAGSAGEHKRRLLKLNSPRGGSPSTSQMPSRAGSPTPAAPTSSKGAAPKKIKKGKRTTLPTLEELRLQIPPAPGINVDDFRKTYSLESEDFKTLIAMIKKVANFTKATRFLTRKPPAEVG